MDLDIARSTHPKDAEMHVSINNKTRKKLVVSKFFEFASETHTVKDNCRIHMAQVFFSKYPLNVRKSSKMSFNPDLDLNPHTH